MSKKLKGFSWATEGFIFKLPFVKTCFPKCCIYRGLSFRVFLKRKNFKKLDNE